MRARVVAGLLVTLATACSATSHPAAPSSPSAARPTAPAATVAASASATHRAVPPTHHPAPATHPAALPTAHPTTAKPVAPPPLTCTASMSNSTPSDYSTTDVLVATAPDAGVTTTAHYKTTDTTHTAVADSTGHADIPYRISRATPGYTVTVDVAVTSGARTGSCSTSFTPTS